MGVSGLVSMVKTEKLILKKKKGGRWVSGMPCSGAHGIGFET